MRNIKEFIKHNNELLFNIVLIIFNKIIKSNLTSKCVLYDNNYNNPYYLEGDSSNFNKKYIDKNINSIEDFLKPINDSDIKDYIFYPPHLQLNPNVLYNKLINNTEYFINDPGININYLHNYIYISKYSNLNSIISSSQNSIIITDNYIELNLYYESKHKKDINETIEYAGTKNSEILKRKNNYLNIIVNLNTDKTMEQFVYMMFIYQEFLSFVCKNNISFCDIILKSDTHKYHCFLLITKIKNKDKDIEYFNGTLIDPFGVNKQKEKKQGLKLKKLFDTFIDMNNNLNNVTKPQHLRPIHITICDIKAKNPYITSNIYNVFYVNVLIETLNTLSCLSNETSFIEDVKYYEKDIFNIIPLDYFIKIIQDMTNNVSKYILINTNNENVGITHDQFINFSMKYTLNILQFYLSMYTTDTKNNIYNQLNEYDKNTNLKIV